MEQIASAENLLSAWRAVRGNIPRYRRMRSAGSDGVTLEDYERDLPAQLGALRQSLLKGSYQPQAPSVFHIRKRGGGQRQLAVLSISDRVAQRAVQQVLEPIWEPHFLPCSYGFRPGLSTHQAVEKARELRRAGHLWVVDGDITACFDSLDHDILVQKVESRVRDKRVVSVLSLWIEQGILQQNNPAYRYNPISAGIDTFAGGIKRTAEMLTTSVGERGGEDFVHPAGYDGLYDDDLPYGADQNEFIRGYERPYMLDQPGFARQRAFQQVVSGGLLYGANLARPWLAKAGAAIITTLKTTAGREILKRSALAGGGLVGAALGVGAAAWLLYREFSASPAGILQGSPLSPLLSNIYLHSFDLNMTRSGCQLVRFADDWVVCCSSEMAAERAYNQAVVALSKIRLKINPEKTQILPPTAPVDWLGERIEPVSIMKRTAR